MISDHIGMMIVVSSPSGVGKTTLVKLLAKRNKNFEISISNTTRTPRKNEIEGKDYYFVKEDKFNNLITVFCLPIPFENFPKKEILCFASSIDLIFTSSEN